MMFWLEEAGLPITGANIARAMQLSPPTVHEMIGRLESDGYVDRADDKSLTFTDKGREEAQAITRRHRLIERFLTDVRLVSPGTRCMRRPSGWSTRCPRCWRSACWRRSATPRPARTAIRSSRAPASRACCWPTSSPAPRCGSCASRTRPRRSCTTSAMPGWRQSWRGSWSPRTRTRSVGLGGRDPRDLAQRRRDRLGQGGPLTAVAPAATGAARAQQRPLRPLVPASGAGRAGLLEGRWRSSRPLWNLLGGHRRERGGCWRCRPRDRQVGAGMKVTPSFLASSSRPAASTSSSRSSQRK